MSVNDSLAALTEQISQITAMLQTSETKRAELERRVEAMHPNDQPTLEQNDPVDEDCDEPDIEPNIPSGNDIQLESYKAIPEFSGKQHEYRSWRNQVYRRMKIIKEFTDHPKYEAALAIIRAKVTGAAADILTNNKTPYNIICILKTLDAAYTDQRPLYAIEASMVAIKQHDKSLHDYFNAINFALNAIISKVVMSYDDIKAQRSLIAEAQKKAIRTFIVGLGLRAMRHILYGQQPKTLPEAYTIAQTVYYDNEHLQLEQCSIMTRAPSQPQGKYNNRTQHEWNQLRTSNRPEQMKKSANEWHSPRDFKNYDKATPMDIDCSKMNWRQQERPQKKEYQQSRQRFEQQPQRVQRINGLMVEPISEDLISNASDDSTHTNGSTSSAFLEE